jgi:branched-chain amino acid transport system permease protein
MSSLMEGSRALRGSVRTWWRGIPRPIRVLVWITLVALLFMAPFDWFYPLLGPLQTTETDFPTTLFTMAYYVLLALGLNVVVGFAGLLDLGYVGFFAVGAYTVAVLTSPDSDLKTRWPWLAAVPIAIFMTMGSGVILGWPTLRLRGDYLAIVTLGFAEIIRALAEGGIKQLRGQFGFSQIPHPPGTYPSWWPAGFGFGTSGRPIFGVIDAKPYYWLALGLVIVVIFAIRNLERSRVGRSWLAIREDEDAAEAMGVPTFRFKLWAFAIGACFGGLSGALFAGAFGFINSGNFALFFSILVLAGVVMGGSGNLPGVILGGALIAYLPERLRGIKDPVFDTDLYEFRFFLFGAALVLIMIFRPEGIIPSRRRKLELADRAKEVTVGE